jgi:hypothetical protein
MTPPFSWEGNNAINTPKGDVPTTSHGPALVTTSVALYMFYSGSGGQDLWCASTYAPNFPAFLGNVRAHSIDTNTTPVTDFRPAAAVVPGGMIHIVYENNAGSNLKWCWFDGAQTWFGNYDLPFQGSHLQPSVAYFNNQLHLVWHNETAGHEYLMHSALTIPKAPTAPTIADWTQPQIIADGAQYPSLVVFNNALYILARDYAYGANPVSEGFVYTKWDGGPVSGNLKLNKVSITGQTPKTNEGPTAIVVGDAVVFVYQGAGSVTDTQNLWYGWMELDPNPNKTEHFYGNLQIQAGTSSPKASAVVGLTIFANKLCIAYKGNGNNIFLTYAPLS